MNDRGCMSCHHVPLAVILRDRLTEEVEQPLQSSDYEKSLKSTCPRRGGVKFNSLVASRLPAFALAAIDTGEARAGDVGFQEPRKLEEVTLRINFSDEGRQR